MTKKIVVASILAVILVSNGSAFAKGGSNRYGTAGNKYVMASYYGPHGTMNAGKISSKQAVAILVAGAAEQAAEAGLAKR